MNDIRDIIIWVLGFTNFLLSVSYFILGGSEFSQLLLMVSITAMIVYNIKGKTKFWKPITVISLTSFFLYFTLVCTSIFPKAYYAFLNGTKTGSVIVSMYLLMALLSNILLVWNITVVERMKKNDQNTDIK